MTSTHLWDRAAALPVPADGRRLPEVVALPIGLPGVEELFTFMRDAELRFATLRMRIADLSRTARGDEVTNMEVSLRHPGQAKVTTSRAGQDVGGDYEIWISDGEIVRTYSGAHKLGTQRPIRNRPRGLDDPDLPGSAQVYEPFTLLPAETLPDTFVHPGGLCQNVLSTGRSTVTGTTVAIGREAILLECEHPRTTELVSDRPDFRLADYGRPGDRGHPPAHRDHRRRTGSGRGGPGPRSGRALFRHRRSSSSSHRDDDALLSPGASRAFRRAV